MKVSEIDIKTIVEHLGLDEGDYSEDNLNMLLTAAIEYVSDYTNIPIYDEEKEQDITLDDFNKFPIAVLTLIQDMYDNRSYYVDRANTNKVVESILNMHRRNYV